MLLWSSVSCTFQDQILALTSSLILQDKAAASTPISLKILEFFSTSNIQLRPKKAQIYPFLQSFPSPEFQAPSYLLLDIYCSPIYVIHHQHFNPNVHGQSRNKWPWNSVPLVHSTQCTSAVIPHSYGLSLVANLSQIASQRMKLHLGTHWPNHTSLDHGWTWWWVLIVSHADLDE